MSGEDDLIGIGALAYLVGAQPAPSAWICLLAPEGEVEEAASLLAGALSRTGRGKAQQIEAPGEPQALVALIHGARGVVVVHGLDGYTASDWSHLDGLRSALARTEAVVLVLAPRAADALHRHAQNIASWIYSRCWRWDRTAELLSEEQKRARLDVLGGRFGMTDTEVIAAAEAETLPADPEFAEWLVLLGRGDILEH
jgi:hypothetical protein